jgi:hypothetical protein
VRVCGHDAVGDEVRAVRQVRTYADARRRRIAVRVYDRSAVHLGPSGPKTRTESGRREIASLNTRSTEAGGVVSTASGGRGAALEHRMRRGRRADEKQQRDHERRGERLDPPHE